MASSTTLPTSTYICASVYPRLLNDPAMQEKLKPSTLTSLTPLTNHGLPLPCPEWRRGVDYWTHVSSDRRSQAKGWTLDAFTSTLEWSTQSAAHLTPSLISELRYSLSHAEWEAEHTTPPTHVISSTTPPLKAATVASDAAVPQPPPPHMPAHPTSAPLTKCKPAPGLPPFLSRRSKSSHQQRVQRARFLLGRARTGTVLRRFATAATRSLVDDKCTEPLCQPPALPAPAPAPTLDSIEHALLHCRRHDTIRQILLNQLSNLNLPLTLSTILVAHTPPPPFTRTQLPALLSLTSSFLATIEAERLSAGLVPLDTG